MGAIVRWKRVHARFAMQQMTVGRNKFPSPSAAPRSPLLVVSSSSSEDDLLSLPCESRTGCRKVEAFFLRPSVISALIFLRASSVFALARSRNRRVQLAICGSSFSIVPLDSRLITRQNARFYRWSWSARDFLSAFSSSFPSGLAPYQFHQFLFMFLSTGN